MCICNPGWTGKDCGSQITLNGWSPWTAWSLCDPPCQSTHSFACEDSSPSEEAILPIASLPGKRERVEKTTEQSYFSPIHFNRPIRIPGLRYRQRKRFCFDSASDCWRPERLETSWYNRSVFVETEQRICRPRPCDRYLRVSHAGSGQKRRATKSASIEV
ncbi:unnamed protein product [Protopolystoma xenopodis]|uniref:EGF-like domain-containing protein n=1 Tax=Protopolystoma xenopodis TaxID=117903 RepID=A0A3S5AZW5_9PLAT|nr:unnamed protein product [Protopolystoma xenopodis]